VRKYRLGAHTKSDLKVHLVWLPKYRKPVLTGEVAVRVRDLIRQIAAEHELEIISGKVARDHVHVFVGYRPNQDVSQIMQWLEGISSRCCCRNFHTYARDSGAGIFGREDIWQSAQETSLMRWSRNTGR
jgi:putative transposase